MKSQLMYVELKSGYCDNGPAWIGKVFFSKSGNTVYFNGMAFHRGRGIATEIQTGEYYWISGVKKNGEDRHWAGNQPSRRKIMIDKEVVAEYISLRGLPDLPHFFPILSLSLSCSFGLNFHCFLRSTTLNPNAC